MPAKLSKPSVDYSPGSLKSHCGPTVDWPKGACKHFEVPHGCEIVEGKIEPKFWCKRWSKLGSKMYREE
jgi:hypothetical protein